MSMGTLLMIVAIIVFAILPTFKDRVISVKKLLITPIIFIYLYCQTINKNFILQFADGWVIILGLIIGTLFGAFIRINTMVKADKTQSLIWLPGNYLGLFIFLLIFSVHFVIGYLQAVDPNYLKIDFVEQILLFFLSCTSSVMIGSNSFLYYKYINSESIELMVKT